MNMNEVKKALLQYLESWPDASLEALVLIYRGEASDIDLTAYPDLRIQKFLGLLQKLRRLHRYTDLEEVYEVIDNLCRD